VKVPQVISGIDRDGFCYKNFMRYFVVPPQPQAKHGIAEISILGTEVVMGLRRRSGAMCSR
jgi:hypothetical protein